VRVRRIIKTASEECASAYPRDADREEQHERKIGHGVHRNTPTEIIDNRTSVTMQGIEELRSLPLVVHIQCCSASRDSSFKTAKFICKSVRDLTRIFSFREMLTRKETRSRIRLKFFYR